MAHGTRLTAFRIRESQDCGQETRNCCSAHNLPVMEEWVYGDRALAHVDKTLSYPDDEQTVGLLVVVTS